MQKCRPPSFFQTKTTALHHMLWLEQIAPESIISQKCVWTSTNGRGIPLNHSLNGVSSVTLITCVMEWVQPSSLGSREKTSWYLAKRVWMVCCQLRWPGLPNCSGLIPQTASLAIASWLTLCAWCPGFSSGTFVESAQHSEFWYLSKHDSSCHWGPFSQHVCGYVVLFLTTTVNYFATTCITLYRCFALTDPEVRSHPQHIEPWSLC